jgi:hypothetical protein
MDFFMIEEEPDWDVEEEEEDPEAEFDEEGFEDDI